MRAMTTWFCDAHASWQKGGVENANGRLRRWLPRQIDIDQVSDEEIQDIVITANLTPRTCLGFRNARLCTWRGACSLGDQVRQPLSWASTIPQFPWQIPAEA